MDLRAASMYLADPFDCDLVSFDRPDDWQSPAKSEETQRMMSLRAKVLTTGQRAPYEKKLAFAKKVVRLSLDKGVEWCVAYSGGRDSSILSHLIVELCGYRIPHVMSNTRMEYPEPLRNARRRREELSELGVKLHTAFPDKRPAEVWREVGYPLWSKNVADHVEQYQRTGNTRHLEHVTIPQETLDRLTDAGIRVSGKCCDELKKKPMKAIHKALGIGGVFMGLRASEAMTRRLAYIQQGVLYQSSRGGGKWHSSPLMHWRDDDVARNQEEYNLHIERPQTRQGRSGCVTCVFGCETAKRKGHPNALQELSVSNPTMHKKAMDEWGYRTALTIAGIPSTMDKQSTFAFMEDD